MNKMAKLIFAAIFLASVLTLSHALLRSAANHSALGLDWAIRIGSALALYGAVFFLYSFLLRRFDISVFYPIYTSLAILGVFFTGVLRFNESITPQKTIGVIIIIIGVALLSKE